MDRDVLRKQDPVLPEMDVGGVAMTYGERVAWVRSAAPALLLGVAGAAEAALVFGADPVRVLLASGLAVPLLWRCRHPASTLLLVTAGLVVQVLWPVARIFDQTFVGFLCLFTAGYSLGRYGAGRSTRIVGIAAAAAGGVAIGVTDRDVFSGALAAGLLLAPVLVGTAVLARVRARATSAAQAREIADSMKQVEQARAGEARARAAAAVQAIAIDRVRSMVETAGEAARRLRADPADVEAPRLMARVEQDGREALTDMRGTLGALRSGTTPTSEHRPATTGVVSEPFPHAWLPAVLVGLATTEAVLATWGSPLIRVASALLVAAAMALTVLARRTRPISSASAFWALACALVLVTGTVPASVLVVGMILAAATGSQAPARPRIAGLLLALAGVVAVNGVGGYSAVGDYVMPALLMSLAWLAGSMIRAHETLLAEVARQAEELRRLRDARAAAAAVQERLRLARELHDVVAHHLMVMVVQAGAARRTMETGGEGAIESVEAVRRVGEETVAEIRSLLQLVDPSDPRRGPAHGMADLERLVEGVRGSGLAVDLVVDGQRRSLPDGLDVVAHRVVQESLTNVVRHAEASRASVTVTYLPDRLVLEVVDDGRGMSSGGATGLGIAGMRERTALYGGTCEVSGREEGGVRVVVTLPLEPVGAPA